MIFNIYDMKHLKIFEGDSKSIDWEKDLISLYDIFCALQEKR